MLNPQPAVGRAFIAHLLLGATEGALKRTLRGEPQPPLPFPPSHHLRPTQPQTQAGQDVGAGASGDLGVGFQLGEVDADVGGEVGFVDHQQVRAGEARPAFAGDVLACGLPLLAGRWGI